MNVLDSIKDLLTQIGPGYMMSTAYDTAWVARLTELNEPIGFRAMDWLRNNQLPDGSWGAIAPAYFHDRLVCTLAATIALAKHGDPQDIDRIERGKQALSTSVQALADEASIETIGFELFIPTIFDEAAALGIIQERDYPDMQRMTQQRNKKLAGLPGGVISRFVTLAFSAEMAGTEDIRLLDIENLQEVTGSLGHSPSATAYFALYVKRGDEKALEYLRNVVLEDGGVGDVSPFDTFETVWTLWNLHHSGVLNEELTALCERHLDFLQDCWRPGLGVAYTSQNTPTDSDCSSVVYETLKAFGRKADLNVILGYEEETHFRCYALEANPSISANIHILGALRSSGRGINDPSVQKIINLLKNGQFWFDKWHISPFYTTSHAIIACAGYADDLVAAAVDWVIANQQDNGGWGYFMPTAEETAYALQALIIWRRAGHYVDNQIILKGAEWLLEHNEEPYAPLWIGKCLYTPRLVIRSAVLSALAMAEVELGAGV